MRYHLLLVSVPRTSQKFNSEIWRISVNYLHQFSELLSFFSTRKQRKFKSTTWRYYNQLGYFLFNFIQIKLLTYQICFDLNFGLTTIHMQGSIHFMLIKVTVDTSWASLAYITINSWCFDLENWKLLHFIQACLIMDITLATILGMLKIEDKISSIEEDSVLMPIHWAIVLREVNQCSNLHLDSYLDSTIAAAVPFM